MVNVLILGIPVANVLETIRTEPSVGRIRRSTPLIHLVILRSITPISFPNHSLDYKQCSDDRILEKHSYPLIGG